MTTKNKTLGDIVKEYFPDAAPDFIEYMVWERTGYPCFWDIPSSGSTPEECFRKQLLEFKAEIESKKSSKKLKKPTENDLIYDHTEQDEKLPKEEY